MGFLDIFRRRGHHQQQRGKEIGKVVVENEKDEEEEDEGIYEETLDLGWYYSEEKGEFQLAKIKESDRSVHIYIVGASGTGKSKFLEFLIRQDIHKGNGFGVIDPHGDLVEDVKAYLAFNLPKEELEERVVLFDPTDDEYTVAFNPLEKMEGVQPAEISAELVEAFKKIWWDSWGARMEDLLRNTLIALIEAELTLVDLPRFLIDEDFRLNVLEKVRHPIARQYFKHFNNLSQKTRDEWMESTLNKVNAFLSDDRIREIFSFKKSSFSFREIMDNRKILLLKLDRGRLKENADLIGSLFMTKIKLSAFSRSDTPREKRVPFYLYIDEFQNFATQTFIETLAEARKYGLSLIMAHQNLSQLPEDLQDSILTNCGIQICFRVSRNDAERIGKEFFETTGTEVKAYRSSPYGIDFIFYSYPEEWEIYIQQLQSLPNRCFFAKHKIEGGVIPLYSPEIEPVYEEYGMSRDEYEEFVKGIRFGLKYLRKRRKRKEEDVSERVKVKERKVSKEDERPRTLEEIIASMPPIEKAILWAVGTGNYNASDIYEAGNKKLKAMGYSTAHYSEFKKKFYEMAKLPPEGKGLLEFTKRGRSFYYWLSEWGEIAFAEKFGMPSDRAMNELGGGGKQSKAVCLEVIKEWLEPAGYDFRKEDLIETDLTESGRGYTDIVAEKDGKALRIEIEHRSSKKQIEKNIRKNLEISDELYIIASDEIAKRKAIQVALKVMFRLKEEKPNRDLRVRIGTIDELKRCGFKEWFEVRNE